MNCKRCQEKIVEALAAGAGPVPSELSGHLQTCRVCRQFSETQTGLFRSMDDVLESMVNQTVPPSLVPGVRARLEELPATSRPWIPSWSFALVGAIAILALSVSFIRHRPQIHPNSPEIRPVVSRSVESYVSAVRPPPKSVTSRPNRTNKRVILAAPSLTPLEAAPKVIVLAEERRSFAKFVAEVPEEKEVALTLTQLAPAAPDAPVEIALLEIGSVEVKPLEVTSRE
jgi:hypothetical protein